MGRRISDGLRRFSRGWVTLLALVVFLLFSALVLPQQSRQAEHASGGAGSPDTSLFYSPGDLYAMAEAYGPQGRPAYTRARWTFDLVFPLVYLSLLVTALSWLFARAFPVGSRWQWANLTPLIGTAFDYLENVATLLVMGRYPARTPVVDTLAPAFTLLKWLFLAASFVLLAIGIVAAVRRRDGRKGAANLGRR